MELYHYLVGLLSSLPSQLVPLGLRRITTHHVLLPTPAQASEVQAEGTVILGAGVVGLSTAYYLALALNESAPRPPIVVIEPSQDVCPGASGEATGGLGDFGFSAQTSALGSLSYSLHQQLASTYQGRDRYGFSDLGVFRLSPKGFDGAYSPPDSWGPSPPVSKGLSDLPAWVHPSERWAVHLMAGAPHAAHLDPRRFCHFLRDRCKELGVQFRFKSRATALERASQGEGFTSVTVEHTRPSDATTTTTEVLPCKAVVIAAGPWSTRVLADLLPNTHVKLRMNSTRSAGNHLLVQNPRWQPSDDDKGVYQVFFNNVLPGAMRLDITSFLGGSLYIGGWGAVPEELPRGADDVKAQPEQIEEIIRVARQFLSLHSEEPLEILSAGRCYRPLAEPNRPIITRVKWSLLGGGDIQQQQQQQAGCCPPRRLPLSPVIGGLYINTGHNSDGVTLGPGSGKLMSELILGRETSVPSADFGLDGERLERL
ncbi:FAD dependent oxidoreductase [Aspergillus californicus]